MSLFLWPISNAWQCPHLRHRYSFHLQEIFWSECREHIWAMKLENEAFGSQRRLPCFVPFSNSHLKTDWGLLPLYTDSIPFKIPENPTHVRGQSWVGGRAEDCVIHLVSSSCLTPAGSRLRIWKLNNFQYIKITRQAGKILKKKKKKAPREMKIKLWLH